MRWFLVTWTTYGSWLPGDSRGFRSRHHKIDVAPPERYSNFTGSYNPIEWKKLYGHSKLSCKREVQLDRQQREFVERRVSEIAAECGCSVYAVSVGDRHIHLLVSDGKYDLPKVVQRLKGVSSRELADYGLSGRVWARGYRIRVISPDSLELTKRYVLQHK